MSGESAKPVTVMVGDDHSIVLDGIELSLKSHGFEVIGRAKTVDDVVALYETLRPDVLVLDIKFAEKRTGLDAAKDILAKHPEAKIVFLSQNDQETLIRETYKIGGHAFLTKDCEAAELANAVNRASKGQLYFVRDTAEQIVSALLRGEPEAPRSPLSGLNEREVEIFRLLAQGHTYEEIALEVNLSKKTIANISQAIKDQLGLHRPADITLLAVRLGLIAP